MPNASAMSTGHYLGDTGVFSNTIYTGYQVKKSAGSFTPFIESDAVLGELDEKFGGDFVGEGTLLAAARSAGLSTAAIGKLGPTLMFDHTAREGESTLIFDDSTGGTDGIPVPADVLEQFKKAGLPTAAPPRGTNGDPGKATTPGTLVPNTLQQAWFQAVATQVVLPRFKQREKPFLLRFWSRDPDGSQHFQGDSLDQLTPGINGPTSRAAARNADNNLAGLLAALKALGLDGNTDVIVSADHGFTTISKASDTSPAAKVIYSDVKPGALPPGFLALDLSRALGLGLFDPDADYAAVAAGAHSKRGNGVLAVPGGTVPRKADGSPDAQIIIAANGGSDLVYLPGANARELAPKVVEALLQQDYVSGIFVDDLLGAIPGLSRSRRFALRVPRRHRFPRS